VVVVVISCLCNHCQDTNLGFGSRSKHIKWVSRYQKWVLWCLYRNGQQMSRKICVPNMWRKASLLIVLLSCHNVTTHSNSLFKTVTSSILSIWPSKNVSQFSNLTHKTKIGTAYWLETTSTDPPGPIKLSSQSTVGVRLCSAFYQPPQTVHNLRSKHFAQPKWHVLSLLHAICICGVT